MGLLDREDSERKKGKLGNQIQGKQDGQNVDEETSAWKNID